MSKILKDNSIFFEQIGTTQKGYLEVKNEFKTSLHEIKEWLKFWFNNYFKDNK